MEAFTGVTAMVPTAFDGDGEVDLFAFGRILERQFRAGNAAAICGEAGEGKALRGEEKLVLIGEARGVYGRRAGVYVCLDAEEGEKALEFGEEAAAQGADGLILEGGKAGARGFYTFVREAAGIGLPVCVIRGSGEKGAEIYAELAAIAGVKAIAGRGSEPFEDLRLTEEMSDRRAAAGEPYLICANERALPFVGVTGARGVMTPCAALFPLEYAAIWRSAGARTAGALRFAPLGELLAEVDAPALMKWALNREGLCLPTVRLPQLEPDYRAARRMGEAMNNAQCTMHNAQW